MEDAKLEDWATAVLVRQRIAGHLPTHPRSPVLAVMWSVGEVFRPNSPTELFSDEQPSVPRIASTDDVVPIDEVLGRYSNSNRTIKIFTRNIERYAKWPFDCDPTDLETIVRLHEYAHAIVHLGVKEEIDRKYLSEYTTGTQTDWANFLTRRDGTMARLDRDSGEFLAQLVSWKTLIDLGEHATGNKLRELFIKVMDKQPSEYKLSEVIVKNTSQESDLAYVLNWIREDPACTIRPKAGYTQRDLIEALASRSLGIR